MMTLWDHAMFCLKACGLIFLLVLAYVSLRLFNLLVISPALDPIAKLPGPDTDFFKSHISKINDPSYSASTHKDWLSKYGKTFRFHGLGKYDYRLMTFDFRSVTHVLSSPAFEKPPATRYLLGAFLGRGVFAMEGDEHRMQRKIIAPAFTTQAVNDVTPVMYEKAVELRDIWSNMIESSDSKNEEKIDVSHWLSRAAFDAFGVAGFGYNFGALGKESNEFYSAFRELFKIAFEKSLLSLKFPIIDTIFPNEQVKRTKKCLSVIHETRTKLFLERKTTIIAEKQGGEIKDRDLMSLLIKSNLSNDASKRLSESDLLDQFSAFLFAGSDSTSIAITWVLHLLAINPTIQSRLRYELASIPANSSPDAYDRLPFLEAVVRETLRLCPPIHGTLREAVQDDLVPVSSEVILRDGTIIPAGGHIPVRKGTYIHVPIEGLNMHEEIWGPDAQQFNPDRWLQPLPPKSRTPAFPGVANLLTFSLGPHSCPGWKFAIAEVKAFVAILLPVFAFRQEDGQNIGKFNGILMRPFDRTQWRAGKGLGLPIIVSKYEN